MKLCALSPQNYAIFFLFIISSCLYKGAWAGDVAGTAGNAGVVASTVALFQGKSAQEFDKSCASSSPEEKGLWCSLAAIEHSELAKTLVSLGSAIATQAAASGRGGGGKSQASTTNINNFYGAQLPPTGDQTQIGVPNPAAPGSLAPQADLQAQASAHQQIADNYKADGYRLSADGKSIETPGANIPVTALRNPSQLSQALGISPARAKEIVDEISKSQEALAKALAGHAAAVPVAGGGAGGRASGAELASELEQERLELLRKQELLRRRLGARNLASTGDKVAGLYRNHAGEPVGVSVDDIFTMVSRRYVQERQQKSFDQLP